MATPPPDRRSRRQLGFAAAAVLLAAADTYVVVAILPSVMSGVGLTVDRLQRATPIISGFLLGYTVVLPLLGRLSDVIGRVPVFVGCLTGFALGSLLTATAHSLGVLVAGRALQGLGGGGLVPVTLSLVAAHWPPGSRGLPLGVVGAVQELGSVLGPLYGAAVVSVSSWRTVFWINLPLAGLLGLGFVASRSAIPAGPAGPRRHRRGRPGRDGRVDIVGPALLGIGLAGLIVGLADPPSLANSVTYGSAFTPWLGGAAWAQLSSPLTVISVGSLVAGLVWEAAAPWRTAAVLPLRRIPAAMRSVDLLGAALLAVALACVVVLFSTEDPGRQVVASSAPTLVPVGVVALAGFAWRQRRSTRPLIPPGLLAPRPAWGALAVNLALGAALMAALVDVPLFARATVDPGSQIDAAVVLVRFLVAVPIGAVAGGYLSRHAQRGPLVAAGGAAIAAVAFVAMAGWGAAALATPLRIGGGSLGFTASDVELVAAGLGFGLAIAPVNASILAAVADRAHGLASSLVVVARTIGMLAGLSALTAIGLHRFYQAQTKIGSPLTLCPTHPASCPRYLQATTAALLTELHTIFIGAALCAGAAAVLAIALLGGSLRSGAVGDSGLPAESGLVGGSALVTPAPPGGAPAGDGPGQLGPVAGAVPTRPAMRSEPPGV